MDRNLTERLAKLSPANRALLEMRLQEKGFESFMTQSIPRRATRDSAPLSFAQQRLWFLDQFEPNSTLYGVHTAIRLGGALDHSALQKALDAIVSRHEVLRTNFVVIDGTPVQVIAECSAMELAVVDLSDRTAEQREQEVKRLMREEALRPFNLACDPMLRAKLFRLDREDHALLLTMHHIVSDGWSMGILFREISDLYQAFRRATPSPLRDLPVQYADYAVWQRESLQGEALESQLSYWKVKLDGVPTLELPLDRPRPAVQTFRGARQNFVFSAALCAGLKTLGQRRGATLFMTLLAAFQTLLHRYTGQDDIVVGSPIAGRTRQEIEGLIGFFVNTLVLRADLSGNPTFIELLGRVRELALEAYAHQDLPFEKLVEELQPKRSLGYSPLFQVMFILHNTPSAALNLEGLTVSHLEVDSEAAKFDLTLSIREQAEGLSGCMQYNTDLFDAPTITRMVGHLRTLLDGIAANPEQRLSQLPLLTGAERRQLLVEWNDTHKDYPKDKCIHDLFEVQAARTPDAVAVVFENQQLTYRELNRRANQLAHYLQKLQVGPEALVGIYMKRSLDTVVAVLAVLKAGGAYVPLDPEYPRERIAFMLQDSHLAVLLTEQRLAEKLPEHEARVVYFDGDSRKIVSESDGKCYSAVHAGNLAYVLYTSGSTGKPKGVAIEHHGPQALLSWAKSVFTPAELAGVLASTSLSFDLSVFELFAPLTSGGKVILAQDAVSLPSLPAASEVTLINTVPSAMAELLSLTGIPSSVGTINLAGELLRTSLAQQIYAQTSAKRVYDLYGPSEDTTYSTFALRTCAAPPTIGRPIANTQCYILDFNLQPLPVGVAGELHIGGHGLARGYHNRPDLTAERFVPNPFSAETGARLYKTGDLARYLPDGNIEFLGRIDQQVKVRGFRIELGEIEAVLVQHPAIAEVVAVAREDVPGEKCLVAYVVPREEPAPTTSDLRRFLKQKLPDYMVPGAFVFLSSSLPLTPNGKVNRSALPAPDQSRPKLKEAFVAPRSPAEETVAGIWENILGRRKIGIHDNFFELGGHSLLATQVVSRLSEVFHIDLPLRILFEKPTVAELAMGITQLQAEKTDASVVANLLTDIESLSDEEAQILVVNGPEAQQQREADAQLLTDRASPNIDLPQEQRAIRAKCAHPSNTFVPFDEKEIDQSIPARFEQIARKYPDRLAVKTRRRQVTYEALNRAANRLAHSILARREQSSEPVGLFIRDYVPLLIAHLAVLKAGKISFAVDPAAPPARTAHLLNDSQTALIIADAANSALARPWVTKQRSVTNVDELDSALSEQNPGIEIQPDAYAYLRYTSGSTGQAKGGIKTHRHILHDVLNFTNYFRVCAEDRLTMLGAASLGKHAFEVLLNGGALCPFDVKEKGFAGLTDWLISQEITLYYSFPTAFRHFVSTLSSHENFSKLRLIELEGEPVYKTDVELYTSHFSADCLLVNTFSSAETGTVCLYFVDQTTQINGNRVPVGYPVADVDVLLLDETGGTVGLNQIGEVAVRGRYLASGYWQRPDLTREIFHGATDGEENRLYLTGDLGRMSEDGCLELLGRKDFQVKIRSFRVDTSEVEGMLAAHPEVKQSIVIAKQDRAGNTRLIAYVVPYSLPSPTPNSLRAFLRDKLPDYMIPSAFVTLDELPLMATGKVDRRALPELGNGRPELATPYVPPRNPIEEQVAQIWREVLSLDRVGIHDNFLDLGGHSLTASQVVSRVLSMLQIGLPVQSLLQAATVADMAAAILQAKSKEIGDEELATILSEEGLTDPHAKDS